MAATLMESPVCSPLFTTGGRSILAQMKKSCPGSFGVQQQAAMTKTENGATVLIPVSLPLIASFMVQNLLHYQSGSKAKQHAADGNRWSN